jgi:hypothetical protein
MPEECCLPGDITVTRIHTGFLIGRALERRGSGPWWEYIKTVTSFRQATLQAHRLAKNGGVRAWFHKHGDDYDRLPKWKRKRRRRKSMGIRRVRGTT